MMMKLRYYLFILFCTVIFINAKATHNRAGEITYKWLYGYTYQIKVTTYTNIGGSNLADRCEDTVYFGDGTRALVLRSNGLCTGPCSPACEGQPLSGNTIKLNEYVTTHSFPGPGNYNISMEDPNRNAGVINIPNSVNQVFYIESYLVIPAFGTGKNNSPILTFPPIDNGCLNKCFYHNPGAYDIDGDSLSYELTTSKGSSGVTCPGYTYPTTGGGSYSVDATTGTVTWCTPQQMGEYNLAMIIKEWRKNDDGDYFLIGSILRDLQVSVGACSNSLPEIIINNSDIWALAGSIITKTISATDPDFDVLTLEANGGPFGVTPPKATFSAPVGLNPDGIFTWQTTFAHVRREPYQVTVKVKDNDPTVSLVHFKTFNIKIIANSPLNLMTTTPNNHILLQWNKPANFALTGPNPFVKYNVYRKDGLSNWVHNNNETVPPAYTGFAYLGSNFISITDTAFHDYNSGNPFISLQDYSYVVLAEYADGSTSYVSNIASSQLLVGLKEQVLTSSDIQIFPNPVSDDLLFILNQNNYELFNVELTDITGRTIKTLTTQENITKQNTIQLNLENINPGIYFLKITGNKHTSITQKIVKQ